MAEPAFVELNETEQSWLRAAHVEARDGWTHLRIVGEPYARGFQHGYLVADQFAELVATYRFITLQTLGVDYQVFVDEAVTLHKAQLGSELTAEMSGIADGLTKAGVAASLDDVIGWNAWIEMSGSWWPENKAGYASHSSIDRRGCRCSAFIATGDATSDGGIVLAHETFDDFWNGNGLNLVLEIWPSTGAGIIMQSTPGYIASMTDFFITSNGVAGAETTIAGFHGYDATGVPEFVRARRAMQYATSIDTFVELLQDGNNGGYANTWLVGDIATGEIAEFQQGLRFQKLLTASDGYFAGANGVSDPSIRNLECSATGYNDIRQQVGARRTRWPQLLDKPHGAIDADFAMEALADHYDLYTGDVLAGATTICAHYDTDPRHYMSDQSAVESTPFVAMGSMDAKVTTGDLAADMSFVARYGRACGTAFDADSYLDRHPQWNWLAGHLPSRPTQPWAEFRATRPAEEVGKQ